MQFKSLLTLSLLTLSLSALADDLPDPGTTPGATDPAVTQANIRETICIKGYTKTVRPPAHYTSKMKRRQIGRETEYGADKKDELELRLMNLVCRGNLPLATAQHDIATNWIEAYKKYGGEKYHGHTD